MAIRSAAEISQIAERNIKALEQAGDIIGDPLLSTALDNNVIAACLIGILAQLEMMTLTVQQYTYPSMNNGGKEN